MLEILTNPKFTKVMNKTPEEMTEFLESELEPVTAEEVNSFWAEEQRKEDSRDCSAFVYEILFNEAKPISGRIVACTFETFECKDDEYTRIKNECENFNASGKSNLILCGGVGTGKTHLAISIMKTFPKFFNGEAPQTTIYGIGTIRTYRRANCLFLPFNRFQDELEDARQAGMKDRLMERYLANDMVCLDDLRLEDTTPTNRKNIFTLINGLYEKNKKIIVTTNSTFKEIENFDSRIADRLKDNGKVLAFNVESFRKFNNKN